MKSPLFKFALAAAAIFFSMSVFAAGQEVQLLLKEEKVFGDSKDCYYEVDVNLGLLAQAKPFQILRATDLNHYEPMRFAHYVSFNAQREMVLHISSSAGIDKSKACPAGQAVLLLN